MHSPLLCYKKDLVIKYTFQDFDAFSSSFMAFPDFFLVVKYYFVQEIEEVVLLLIKNYHSA